MRVMHVIPSMDPSTGGPPRVLSNMVRGQLKLGYEVSIISRDKKPAAIGYLKTFFSDSEIVNINVLRLNYIGSSNAALESYSLLHLHGFWNPIFVYSFIFSIYKRIPFVIEPDGILNFYGSFFKKWKKFILFYGFYQIILRRSSLVLAGSKNEKLELCAIARLNEKKIKTLNLNAVDLEDVERLTSSKPLKKHLGLPPSFFIFVGRWHCKKGVTALLKAYDILNEQLSAESHFNLVLIGPSRAEVENYFNRQGRITPDWLYPLGELHGRQKWAILSQAHFFILPSYQEGFPVSVIESLASGTPVVVSKQCNIEASSSGAIVVLDAVEPLLISDTVLNLCKVGNREMLRLDALDVARTYFNIDNVVENLDEMYQEVLKGYY